MPGKSVINRDVEAFNPGPDGNYREWVDYRQKVEITNFLAENQLDVDQAAEILFPKPGPDDKTNKFAVLLRTLLYKQPRERVMTQEARTMMEEREIQVGQKYLSWPNTHYIFTGRRFTRLEEDYRNEIAQLRSERVQLKELISNLEATNKAYKDLINGRKV